MKPHKWSRKATISILVTVVSALIAWDIWVFVEPTEGDTISEVVLGFAREHPVFALVLGVVMGHLLWPQRIPKEEKKEPDPDKEPPPGGL